MASIRARKSAEQEYLRQLLMMYEPRWERFGQGSTFDAINGDDLRALKLKVPSLAEQNKIAEVLNTCDAELYQLQAQLNALRRQKQGLMQVLLTGKVRVKG